MVIVVKSPRRVLTSVWLSVAVVTSGQDVVPDDVAGVVELGGAVVNVVVVLVPEGGHRSSVIGIVASTRIGGPGVGQGGTPV